MKLIYTLVISTISLLCHAQETVAPLPCVPPGKLIMRLVTKPLREFILPDDLKRDILTLLASEGDVINKKPPVTAYYAGEPGVHYGFPAFRAILVVVCPIDPDSKPLDEKSKKEVIIGFIDVHHNPIHYCLFDLFSENIKSKFSNLLEKSGYSHLIDE